MMPCKPSSPKVVVIPVHRGEREPELCHDVSQGDSEMGFLSGMRPLSVDAHHCGLTPHRSEYAISESPCAGPGWPGFARGPAEEFLGWPEIVEQVVNVTAGGVDGVVTGPGFRDRREEETPGIVRA